MASVGRTYPVPAKIRTPLLGSAPTMSEIDLFVEAGYGSSEERAWALSLRSKFVSQQLDRICGSASLLPLGLVSTSSDTDVVVALGFSTDVAWNGKWLTAPPTFDDTIILTGEEVAFTIDALEHGASGLALRAACPLALLERTGMVAADTPPANAKFVAVLDDLDRNAVMELLAILPGPVVMRRNDGKWERDNQWLRALKGVKPPPVSILDAETMQSVAAQVDEATKGKPFEEAVAGSGFDQRLQEMQVGWMLLGAEVITAAMPAKLQKYWLTGPGAAKIRWFTPGSWRRCYRHLVKYMPPYQAKGACTNMSQKLGGHGVATHVGS